MVTTLEIAQSRRRFILLLTTAVSIPAIVSSVKTIYPPPAPWIHRLTAFQSFHPSASSSSKRIPEASTRSSFCSRNPFVHCGPPIFKKNYYRNVAKCNIKKTNHPEVVVGISNRLISAWRLRAKSDDDSGGGGGNNNNQVGGDDQKPSSSTARVGGRSTSPKRIKQQIGTNENDSGPVGTLLKGVKNILKLIVVVSILRSLLGFLFGLGSGGGDGPSYVYYQSTVYESSSISADGKVEKIRKESVKSNIPSLISGDRVIEEEDVRGTTGSGSTRKSSYLLRDYSDIAVDKDRFK